jgi:AraC-like DNA-binding protein
VALQQVHSATDLIARSGVFLAGRIWLYAVPSPAFHAYAIWGCPSESDILGLVALFTEMAPHIERHVVLADVRDLRDVSPAPFRHFLGYLRQHTADLGRVVSNACILHDTTMTGAMAAGFFQIVEAPFPFGVHTDVDAALAALEFPTDEFQRFEVSKTDAMRRGAFGDALAAAVECERTAPTRDAIAKRMGMSSRTLSRRIKEHGTTLPREVERIRLSQALRGLETTDTSVTELAYELGFSSPEHFSRAFRRTFGTTPTAYREAVAVRADAGPVDKSTGPFLCHGGGTRRPPPRN